MGHHAVVSHGTPSHIVGYEIPYHIIREGTPPCTLFLVCEITYRPENNKIPMGLCGMYPRLAPTSNHAISFHY